MCSHRLAETIINIDYIITNFTNRHGCLIHYENSDKKIESSLMNNIMDITATPQTLRLISWG